MEGSRAAQEKNYASSQCWARRFHSVKGDRLTSWVSTLRSGMPCSVINYISGTLNLNCHIRFNDSLEWIVRFPVAGRAMGDIEAKVRHEVAVMKLIRSRTRIPVPEVVTWGPSHACPLGLGPFIVMPFVEGKVLSKLLEVPGHLPGGKIFREDIDPTILEYIYRQVARFIMDLAEIEFSSLGTIIEDRNSFDVESGPVTVKMNDIERQDGVSLQASPTPFQTTTAFFESLISLEMEHLKAHPESVSDALDAKKKYQRLKRLTEALPQFVNPDWDAGPFVLRCEGMRFGNMLVDENFKITAVLDWEWSYTAPKQMLCSPPRWLIIRRPMHWNVKPPWEETCSTLYQNCFHKFIRILAEEEDIQNQTRPADRRTPEEGRLSCLMRNSLNEDVLWFHELLLTPSAYDNEFIWNKLQGSIRSDGEERESFQDEEVQSFIKTKMDQVHSYESGSNASPGVPQRSLLSISIKELLDI